MKKIWNIKDPDVHVQDQLARSLNISTVTAQILANRGVRTSADAHAFLNVSLSSCHDPLLLKGMARSVTRIRHAIASKEKILVYGDYDVDGITGVALLTLALRRLGGIVTPYIPHRVEEGYGLNVNAVKKVHADGIALIVTVDCGIGSFKEIDHARGLGIDTIVTDHHEIVDGRVPNAHAVINSLQADCSYPFKHLAGVGIAYKLVKALFDGTPHFAEDYLDLVGLGTIADIVPLVGENRVLAKYGIDELNRRGRIGLKALMDVAGLTGKDITSGHIGFILGPRINAMGRIGSPYKALDLLLTDDAAMAAVLAKVLDTENRSRQKIEADILEEALAKVEREVNFKHHRIIVLSSDRWHAGVIGIVASRIAERYFRPTIIISTEGKMGKGSGRSVEGFHLFDALSRCKDVLAGFGGHESACGITIDKDQIDTFRDRINADAVVSFDATAAQPVINIDMDIPLSALKEEVIDEIERLAPFGPENPRPVLASRNLAIKDVPRRIGKNGFKMWVTDNGVTCEAVSFGRGELTIPDTAGGVDLAYIPSMNTWQGVSSIQLELKDVR